MSFMNGIHSFYDFSDHIIFRGMSSIFPVDTQGSLLAVYSTGCVLSYLAVIFNIFVFIILCRKKLFSPATILMQGLALADCFTAFCSYGLEPLFLKQYQCTYKYNTWEDQDSWEDQSFCSLSYPYCEIYTHLSILSVTFHINSFMLTTCLGIQKVIAMLFPIWTKLYLTNRKAVICCILCFLLSIIISLPRHFAFEFEEIEFFGIYSTCLAGLRESESVDVVEYSSAYYFLILTILLTCCCIVMIVCTVYIIFKLATNRFRVQQTEQRRQERRSVVMVAVVLVVFLISEVPKVVFYLTFFVKYIARMFPFSIKFFEEKFLAYLFIKPEASLALMLIGTTGPDYLQKFISFAFLTEGVKLFTVIGCLSNLIIYITMSKKLRSEIKSLCKKPVVRSNVIELN